MIELRNMMQKDKGLIERGPESVYLSSLDASPKTLATYGAALKQWRAFLSIRNLEPFTATTEDLIEFKREKSETMAAASVNAYLAAVRSFYQWTEAKGVYPNIAQGVKSIRRSRHSTKDALTIDQARRLLSLADGAETLTELRNAAIVETMLRCGLRAVEVARANIGDIHQRAGRAVLSVRGKGYAGAESGIVVLTTDTFNAINEYLRARGEHRLDAPLFAGNGPRNDGGRLTTRSVSRIVQYAYREAGIDSERITAHSLRHTAVTFALMGGADLRQVQAMARHASIDTTMIYSHELDRLDHPAEDAIDRILSGTNQNPNSSTYDYGVEQGEHGIKTQFETQKRVQM